MIKLPIIVVFLIYVFPISILYPQDSKKIGKVTGLEIPRFVSLKKSKTYLRRGPGKSYKIDWILEQNSYPLKVIAEHEHWRQVIDFQGDEGWVYFRLLSGKRTIIISKEEIFLRKTSKKNSNPVGILKYGVIGELIDTTEISCNVKFQNIKGWINKDDAWGC
tara:strand:- start:117 stop:602 length:486 start_codon:yes stop_codon:yes gene_type:complete